MSLSPVSSGDPHVPAHNAEREEINALAALIDDRIPFPGGLATGDLLRWDGTQFVSTETRFFEGHGNPNGVVAAPVGSRYVDMDATRGAVDWVKSSGGTGNTGWSSSIGALAPIGQTGTISISGPSAVTKQRLVPLDSKIFLGAAPRFVLVTATGGAGDYAHAYVDSKVANGFNVGVRHINYGTSFTAATVINVDYFAIV